MGQTDSAYWSMDIQSFQIFFGSGNFDFFDNSMILEHRNYQEMTSIIANFIDKF